MINTIEKGIGIRLLPIIGIGIGFKQILFIGIANFCSGLLVLVSLLEIFHLNFS